MNDISLSQCDWRLTSTPPGATQNPAELTSTISDWLPAIVPGTVAQSLNQENQWDLTQEVDFDSSDWWYHCNFRGSLLSHDSTHKLSFDGLATLAEVWLNGECILRSENMFIGHILDISSLIKNENDLHLCFRSLNAALSVRKPRPQWKTKLVNHQQLRWYRTTLLGRIPGWSPPVPPIGPWRSVHIETFDDFSISNIQMRPYLQGETGTVDFECILHSSYSEQFQADLSTAGHNSSLEITKDKSGHCRLHGQLCVPNVPQWWPHTHGKPVLHECTLEISINKKKRSISCGNIGFRQVSVNKKNGAFDLKINEESIFCRGACWTVNDIISLTGDTKTLKQGLTAARDAGMNMIRIGGTMIYESEEFYTLCDELGILIWQDFMFANMDYPIADDSFRTSVETEITQQVQRWRRHPCITIYCGSSEIEQQAAMLGIPKAQWRNALFSDTIPTLCSQWHPDIPYIPSSPMGDGLPFQVGNGVSHYYGVGAYMRPVSVVRRAKVRFTSECLGFANIPESETIKSVMRGQQPACHHPYWKQRIPRDSGAGWDFEDIRDYYLELLYSTNPIKLRSFDMERYLALSRTTTGEIMGQVFSEWRSSYNECGGGLVWFMKDLWPGAGWGIMDSNGIPKACFYYLKRVWQPTCALLTDEGLDGVHVHIINEIEAPLKGKIECQLIRDGHINVAKAEHDIAINKRSSQAFCIDDILGGFYDSAYAYRFGPAQHHLTIATLYDDQGNVISEAFHFPENRQPDLAVGAEIIAETIAIGDHCYQLTLQSSEFLYAVHFDIKDYLPDDNYFHLAPGRCKVIMFNSTSTSPRTFKGYIETLSLNDPVKIPAGKNSDR